MELRSTVTMNWLKKIASRPLSHEMKTILTYPMQSWGRFVVLSLLMDLSYLPIYSGSNVLYLGRYAFFVQVVSIGLLMWYSFDAINQISRGLFQFKTPEFESLSALSHCLILGYAARFMGILPVYLIGVVSFYFVLPQVSRVGTSAISSQQVSPSIMRKSLQNLSNEELLRLGITDQSRRSLIGSTIKPRERAIDEWMIFIRIGALILLPATMLLAALTESVRSVLNPLNSIYIIKRLGTMYWKVVGLFALLELGQIFSLLLLSSIPFGTDLANRVCRDICIPHSRMPLRIYLP
jgi:hypothetical protein